MIKEEGNIRVRFAPSPTGLLHVGSFRTALFNWLFARKYNGKFILRIEDTDLKRSSNEFLESQLADLKWMDLDWDEGPEVGGCFGPYFQMQRLDIYKKQCMRLVEEGKAYYCYCTPDELKEAREKAMEKGEDPKYPGRCKNLSSEEIDKFKDEGRKPCVRFSAPIGGVTVFRDAIKGDVPFENKLLDDFVIMKSDGAPTYNFAVVVDDHMMGITHVIRGDEHVSNTPRQALLFDALGYERPLFCHIPIILNTDKTKLSKRKGAVHLLEFRDRGYVKEALFNFLALLGWAPKDDREVMSKEEIIDAFSLEGISKSPAVFDENKLIWMNSQYLNVLPVRIIIERLKPFLEKINANPEIKDEQWYEKAILLYREKMKTLVDFADNLSYYFRDVDEYDEKGVGKYFKPDFLKEAMPELARRIEQLEVFNGEELEKVLRDYAEELGQPAGKLIHAVRLAISGRTVTPPIFDVMVLFGREELVRRLNKAADFIARHQETKSFSAS